MINWAMQPLYIFSMYLLKREETANLCLVDQSAHYLVGAFQRCPPSANDDTKRPIRSSYVNWVGSGKKLDRHATSSNDI